MIRIGVLGCGRVVQNRYVEVFTDELRDARVVRACDTVPGKADTVAGLLGCQAAYDEAALFGADDVDVVLVCTESGKHYDHARKALEAGKHVITEKPPTLLPEQVAELEALARERGRMYAVIFQNRYNPAMRALKDAFDRGRFGKLVLATMRLRWCRYQDYYEDGWHGTWAMDGGVINQQAIHHADALQWVCGDIASVCADTGNLLNSLEAEDTMVALARFRCGAKGVIEATTAARPEDFEASISVVGEQGCVMIGGIALNKVHTWRFVAPEPGDEDAPARFSQEVPTGYGLSHGPLMQDIVDRLGRGETEPPITGGDSLPVLRLVHALYRSDETRAWVSLDETPLSARLGR